MKGIYWLLLVVVAGGAIAAWKFWPSGPAKPSTPQAPAATTQPATLAGKSTLKAEEKPKPPPPPPAPVAPPPPKVSGAQAAKLLAEAQDALKADQPVEAREKFSQAYNSDALGAADADKARAALIGLADRTIFSPIIYPNDPYTSSYKFEPGDLLARVERNLALHVPPQVILDANRIARAESIRAGQTLKMIRGPFRAVVRKGTFLMDVYLQDTFVRRFSIGLGAAETPTPEGHFRVRQGGKLLNALYTPPTSSGLPQKAIRPGQEGYPLDAKGHWISLTGIPEKGTNFTEKDGYGIHGTNAPSTIGKASSHGCIRLGDADIETVFGLLYDVHSTVDILP